MPRRKRFRKIVAPPSFDGYKPYGASINSKQSIEFFYEEYEAMRLADYDMLNHQEAAELMGVSRATFARIYETARRKIAKAFVESLEIVTVYGNAWMENAWYSCASCQAKFTLPENNVKQLCPLCGSKSFELLNVIQNE